MYIHAVYCFISNIVCSLHQASLMYVSAHLVLHRQTQCAKDEKDVSHDHYYNKGNLYICVCVDL